MVGGAAELIEEVASKKIAGEEDRYSRTDLVDFQANVDGAQKIVALLDPLVQKRDPALVTRVKGNFAKVDAVLGKYRTAHGFESYDKLDARGPQQAQGPGDGAGRGPVDAARHAGHRLIHRPPIPAKAEIQRKKAAEGRQDLGRVPPAAPFKDWGGLRPDISRWIPASAGIAGRGRGTMADRTDLGRCPFGGWPPRPRRPPLGRAVLPGPPQPAGPPRARRARRGPRADGRAGRHRAGGAPRGARRRRHAGPPALLRPAPGRHRHAPARRGAARLLRRAGGHPRGSGGADEAADAAHRGPDGGRVPAARPTTGCRRPTTACSAPRA